MSSVLLEYVVAPGKMAGQGGIEMWQDQLWMWTVILGAIGLYALILAGLGGW